MKIRNKILVVIFLSTGCNNHQNATLDKVEYSNVDADVEEFKTNFFIRCFDYGYEGDICMDSIINEDVSRMGDFPLGLSGYRAVDSFAREVRKEIVADSIMLMTRRDYEMGKKRVFQICLKHYSGTTIDSVAREVLTR